MKQPAREKFPPDENSASEKPASEQSDDERGDRPGNHSIRVHVETLDHLMTTVSELVLTRNQLLEIVRRHEDSDFKVPLQRLSNVTAELQEGVMKTRMQPIGNAWQKLPRDRARSFGRTRQARSNSRCTVPKPNLTVRCWSWSRTR